MSHLDLTKTPSTTDPAEQSQADCSRRGPAAFWLVAIGVILLASELNLHLPVDLGAAVLFIPFVGAVLYAIRTVLRTGLPNAGALWFLFGAAFPALIGVNQLTGTTIDLDWVPAVGFIVIGALVATGVVTPRRRRRAGPPVTDRPSST